MKKTFFYHALSALFIGSMAFSAVSCADDDLGDNANNGDNGAVVRFSVSDAQDDAQSRSGALTRSDINPELTDKDLSGQKLDIQSTENLNACLIETTIEGVNPVKIEPSTRANIITSSTLGNFSSSGIRSTVENTIGTNWFDNKSTTAQGVISLQSLGHGSSVSLASMLFIQRVQIVAMVLLFFLSQQLQNH
ncbi:hypothetical protein [Prevotella scopos]|uniref:hypothetical protein n=1 Tax=Prevotella scopos TaxID=589437 RepID=UPI000A4725F3|nr:hypothetical protein [Prevotella scopos]